MEARPKMENREFLQGLYPKGAKVYGILRRVSRSGMTRAFDLYVVKDSGVLRVSREVGELLGIRLDKYGMLVVGGCGADMLAITVHELGVSLWEDGYSLHSHLL